MRSNSASTYELAVDPKVETARDRTEMGDDLLPLIAGWYVYPPAVIALMVVFDRDKRRVVLGTSAPHVSYIQIDGITIAIELPVARDGHRPPILLG